THGSGISPDIIVERGYRSAVRLPELRALGFKPKQQRIPALVLPIHGTDGSNGLYQIRPDEPRINRDGDPIKYETPVGASMHLDCPPRCRPMMAGPCIPL